MFLYPTERPAIARFLRRISVGAVVVGMLTSGTTAHAASPLAPGTVIRSNGTMYVIADPNAPAPAPVVSFAPAHASAAQSPSTPVSGSATPLTPTTNPLYVHGSNPIVMEAGTKAYNVFWQPQNSGTWATYNSDMSRFFSDIGGTGYYGNLTQYYDSYIHIQNHSGTDGNWQDTQHYPTLSYEHCVRHRHL